MAASVLLVIDPGHGGVDPGAIGPTGLHEADVALDVGLRLRAVAEAAGLDVVMTRKADVHLGTTKHRDLTWRCNLANRRLADRRTAADPLPEAAFISIHCNAAVSPHAHGFECWTSRGYTRADPLATEVYHAVKRRAPELRGRVDNGDGDPDKEASFFVLVHTLMPAVLVELAFISNPTEEALLRRHDVRQLYADAMLDAVLRWRGSAEV